MRKKILLSIIMLAALQSGVQAASRWTDGAIGNTIVVNGVNESLQDGEAVDFTLKDINGNDFKLSSLKGKYVIVDFWGSWCINCIKGFPKMKEYYAKYKDKLEIVSVDCNDADPRWKAAVKKHELPWINVYNPRGAGDITAKFGIKAFPTKMLLDPEGKVVKTFVGEDDSFYTILDSSIQQ